jgi:hypothetical protein
LSDLPISGEAWAIPADEEAKRADLRHLRVCSVDPPGCTDIDDALHCLERPDGTFEVKEVGFSYFFSLTHSALLSPNRWEFISLMYLILSDLIRPLIEKRHKEESQFI